MQVRNSKERLFAAHPVELASARYAVEFTAGSAETFIDMLADFYGPLLQVRNKLAASGRWEDVRAELIALSDNANQAAPGGFRAPSDYLVTVARKRL